MQEKQREPSWRRGVSPVKMKQLLAFLYFLGFSFPPPPYSPLCTPDMHMHTHMAGSAQAAWGGRHAVNTPPPRWAA